MEVGDNNSDVVFDYLTRIRDEYCALKIKLKEANERIRILEIENVALKINNNKWNQGNNSSPEESAKRRKLLKPELLSPNNSSILELDPLNSAMQDISSNFEDDEVINATPGTPKMNTFKRPLPSDVKQDPFLPREPFTRKISISHSNMPLSPNKQNVAPIKEHSIHKNKFLENLPKENHKPDESWIAKPKNKVTPTKGTLMSSKKWQANKANKSNEENVVKTKSPPFDQSLDRSRSQKQRLSLSKNGNLKQLKLAFTSDPSDLDETYCTGLTDSPNVTVGSSSQKNLRQKSISSYKYELDNKLAENELIKNTTLLNHKQDNEISEDLLKNVKVEPQTSTHLPYDRDGTKLSFGYDSSVFAVPNETDQIIIIPESEEFLNDTNDAETKETVAEQNTKNKSISPDVQEKREKLLKEGYACPKCAKFLKYIADENITNEEIQKRIDSCPRHQEKAPPSTPEGYWIPYFVPTQEENRKAPLIDYRYTKRPET